MGHLYATNLKDIYSKKLMRKTKLIKLFSTIVVVLIILAVESMIRMHSHFQEINECR